MLRLSAENIIDDRYQLIELLPSGGMGEVWKARDLRLNRIVVLKTVNPLFLSTNPYASKILGDEAIAGAQLLGHANSVAVLDVSI